MALKQIGILARRSETGEFLPAIPIYEDIEEVNENGMTAEEEANLIDISKVFADRFRAYKSECKKAGIKL